MILPAWILLVGAAASAPASVVFPGTVTSGEDFVHEIVPGLLFRLAHQEGDLGAWTIEIVGTDPPTEDFCAVVTPPYRGLNALQIAGWHFLNADGTGPNQGDVNAPGDVREFRFVTDRDDYLEAMDALEGMLWPLSAETQEAAIARHDSIPTGCGTLTVTDVRHTLAGYFPETWELDFEVELVFPGDAR